MPHSDSGDDRPLVLQILSLGDDYVMANGNVEPLGKTLRELLLQAISSCRAQAWSHARACCEAGKRVTQLEPEYRGRINLRLAAGVVEFYLATTLLGLEESDSALGSFQAAGSQLSFIAPVAGAAAWLAVARVHSARSDPFSCLWALQKSWNLVQDQKEEKIDQLVILLEGEYKRAQEAIQAPSFAA